MPDQAAKALAGMLAAEIKASARKKAYALKARHENKPCAQALFRALAASENMRARRFVRLLRGKIRSTSENLADASGDEHQQKLTMYQALLELVDASEAKTALHALRQAMAVERRSSRLYADCMAQAEKGPARTYYVCQVCGNIVRKAPPARCPVCGAQKSRFSAIGQ